MILYHSVQSRGLRVVWLMKELQVACRIEIVPFPPRRKKPEFLEINPLGTVPTLVDGDLTMTESTAIMQYVCAKHGDTTMAVNPGEPDFGRYVDFIHYADTTLTFPLTVYLRLAIFEAKRGLAEAGTLYLDWFVARLVKLEQALQGREYLCGGRFTMADIAVAYPLQLATLIGQKDRLPPVILDYLERLTSRDAYKQAIALESAAPGGP